MMKLIFFAQCFTKRGGSRHEEKVGRKSGEDSTLSYTVNFSRHTYECFLRLLFVELRVFPHDAMFTVTCH